MRNEGETELIAVCHELVTLVTDLSAQLLQTQQLLTITRSELGRIKARLNMTDTILRQMRRNKMDPKSGT